VLFAAVSVLWGIPYFLIKIATADLSPLLVVFGRVAVAAVLLLAVATRRGTLTALRGRAGVVVAVAFCHVIVPFTLITFGEVRITSSLTGLLIAVEPVLIALLLLRREPLTAPRAAGLVTGFAGVAVLLGVDVSGDRDALVGAGMVLLAAASYAGVTVLVQYRAADLPPEALAAGTTTVAGVVLAPAALFALPTGPVRVQAWAAVAALGVLCTAVALLAFYRLIALAGSGRAGLIAYANPIVAALLGVTLLGEPFRIGTLAGFVLVAVGCWLTSAAPSTVGDHVDGPDEQGQGSGPRRRPASAAKLLRIDR